MNIKEKPWDSFVLFAPEKLMEQDTEDYYFYGTDSLSLGCSFLSAICLKKMADGFKLILRGGSTRKV